MLARVVGQGLIASLSRKWERDGREGLWMGTISLALTLALTG